MFKRVIYYFIFALSICNIQAQNDEPIFIKDSLEAYIKTQQHLWQIPAVAVAIIKDGKIVKTITSGVTDIKSNTLIDENTLFMIGSNTKAFTSILIASLAVEKVISLEDPVKKWIPYFKMSDPWLTEKVNVTDILSHRVGFGTFQGDFLNFDNNFTSEEIIKKFALIKPTYDYRETWGYFNTGYTIAGEIVKAATGKTWAEQIQERIFTPLKMKNSLPLSGQIGKAKNKTLAHTIVDDKLRIIPFGDIDATAPAGSISSSISDMSKWVMTLLADGKFNNKEVIPTKAIEETIYPRSIIGNGWHPFNRQQFSLYGFGWDLQDYDGNRMVMHTGGIHGFVTSVTTVPEENLGIIVLTNTDSNYFFEALKWDIVDAYLELPRQNYGKLFKKYYDRSKEREKEEKRSHQKEISENHKPSVSLSNFEGIYRNKVYGWLTIKELKGKLHIDFQHHKDLKVRLSHLKENKFYAVYNSPIYGESVFPFEVENKKVKKFTLKLHPDVDPSEYEFYKE